MDGRGRGFSSSASLPEEEMDLKRGPWTMEEDLILINNIANHGEGRWNALARFAGLKRTGKSCRLRWLNYLRPDIRRGNFTPEEQLLILELHSRWGNRWSKIAQHLPGRTDNEIKNYWRTRVQKQAKQLRCDVNSKEFKDAMRYVWMPRLFERIRASNPNAASAFTANMIDWPAAGQPSYGSEVLQFSHSYTTPENSSSNATVSSDSAGATVHAVSPQESDLIDYEQVDIRGTSYTCGGEFHQPDDRRVHVRAESFTSPAAASYYEPTGLDYRAEEASEPLALGGEACAGDYTWSLDDLWFWQQQLSDGF